MTFRINPEDGPLPAADSARPALLGGHPVRPTGPLPWPPSDPAITEVLHRLAATGEWGRYHGPWCERLSAALAESLQARHVLVTCSGTAAVELALRGLGVQPGDEVLLAAYDFKANFTNVSLLGARPVLVDVRADDWQLDVAQLEAAVSERTRCVIASHLHGGLVDLPQLCAWCQARGVSLLEDACQASGAYVAGCAAGSGGDVGVLSFGGSKLLSAGRGGAVVTDRDDIAQRIRLYQQRGNEAYPLSEMQAAVLVPQVAALPERHRRRAVAVAALCLELQRRGLVLFRSETAAGCDPAYYKLGLKYDPAAFGGLTRDRFAAALRAEGIAIDPGLRGLHRIHARSRFRAAGPFPHADAADAGILTLHHPVLLEGGDALTEMLVAIDRVACHAAELLTIDAATMPSA